MSRIFIGVIAAAACTQVFAQSTATQIADDTLEPIIVESKPLPGRGLMQPEKAPRSRNTVSGDYLHTQSTGQSVFQSLNLVPGLNFTNNDPYGSSGGKLRLRGFDGNHIALMLDGIPLNDAGTHAIYSDRQIDPEIIERVVVNPGTTDIDSPAASTVGGTINIVTARPKADPGMTVSTAFGSDAYQRFFVRGDTGAFGPWGTEALLSASYQTYDAFKGPGDLEKTQVNGRIFQDLGDGDFISFAFHGNRNRNAPIGDYYGNYESSCTRPTPVGGTSQHEAFSNCAGYYNVNINPSDTANARVQSSFGLSDSLTLTIDPSFQYSLANDGGYELVSETDRQLRGATTAPGVDLNGDGDTLDVIGLYTPRNTHTRRYSLSSSLIWELNDTNLLRLAYTLDHAKYRQTAPYGYLSANGNPEDVFAGRKGRPVLTADGTELRGRDRYTVAKLNQVSLGYLGKFVADRLHVSAGVRAPYFEYELNQNCYTDVNSDTEYCTTQLPGASNAQGLVTFPGNGNQYVPAYQGVKKYDKVLPNLGVSYAPWENSTIFFSFAQGFSTPRSDDFYELFGVRIADIEPETANSYDLGYRYEGEKLIASVVVWTSHLDDRIEWTNDAVLGIGGRNGGAYNVGDVKLRGVDGSIGFEPIERLSLYASASFMDTEVRSDFWTWNGAHVSIDGDELPDAPELTFGSRIQYDFGRVVLGLQGKYVGERFSTHLNSVSAPSYTVIDVDARYAFSMFGFDSYLQLNVINATDKDYLGSITPALSSGGSHTFLASPTYMVGAPRTFQVTLNASF